jgi:hypothetical protein
MKLHFSFIFQALDHDSPLYVILNPFSILVALSSRIHQINPAIAKAHNLKLTNRAPEQYRSKQYVSEREGVFCSVSRYKETFQKIPWDGSARKKRRRMAAAAAAVAVAAKVININVTHGDGHFWRETILFPIERGQKKTNKKR